MAKFVEGNPGGPGRPKGTAQISKAVPETKELQVIHDAVKFDKKTLEATINTYLAVPHHQLKDVIHTNKCALDVWVAMLIYNGMAKGDALRLEWICQRMIGKVKDQVEISLPIPTIIERISGGETILGSELRNT